MNKVRAGPAQRPGQVDGSGIGVGFTDDDLGLSFYTNPPNVEVSVREFEECTRDRLKLLHAFDRTCGLDMSVKDTPRIRPKLQKDLDASKLMISHPRGSVAVDAFPEAKKAFVRRDGVSHFALRLAFCKTRDAREWFVKQEQRLFIMRFESMNQEAKDAFFGASGVKCRKLNPKTDEIFGQLKLDEIRMVTPSARIWKEGQPPTFDENFFEMAFFDVPAPLISSRQVVIRGGKAYVPSVAMTMILAKKFKDTLNESLDVAFNGLPTALADPRVGPFLRDLSMYGMQLLAAPKANLDDAGEKLTLDNCEEMLKSAFPPCMRRLVEKQRDMKKHLKHAGRLQLRPFLRECGFSFEDSMRWWQKELCKDPEVDQGSFEKNYTYDIEHTYAKKGHLQFQNCFACPKIINFPAESSDQVHGCPFKNLDTPALKQQLHKWHLPEAQIAEVEKLVSNGKHYQLACMEYFKGMHPGHTGDGVGNAPLDYFRESVRHHIKQKEKNGGGKGTPQKPSPATAA